MPKSTAIVLSLTLALWSAGQAFAGQDEVKASIDEHALFKAVGAMYHLDPALLEAIATAESDGRVDAVSPAGAMGLMQLMPQTAARFSVDDPFDPVESALGAARLLDYLRRDPNVLDHLPELLAAYNAGEGAVERFGGIPPYPETRDYIRRVLLLYLLSPAPLDDADSHHQALAPRPGRSKGATRHARHRNQEVLEQLIDIQRQRAAAQAIDPAH